MKTIKYIPKAARGEGAEFEGYVEITALPLEEKLQVLSDQGLEASTEDNGEVSVSMGKKGNMAFLISMIRLAKPKYVSVKLRHKASGTDYKSYEDLDSDAECHGIISDVAMALLSGFKVGND